MVRALIFFLKLAVLVAIAVWIADQPGRAIIEWQGYRVETTFGILLLVVLAIAAVAAVFWRVWGKLLGLPSSVGGWLDDRRLRKGYQALTQGMVSVAAGEPDEARRHARRADELLDEPPLTMLLSAQAAQLNGDEDSARRYFERMLENEDTVFLGLRGLLRQAEREGDLAAALDYARRAHEIRPQTPWVLNAIFELSLRTGDLERALDAVDEMRKRGLVTRDAAKRRRGVVLTELARWALSDDRDAFARDYSREAYDLAPELVPAARVRAQVLVEDGRNRAAAKVIEKTWGREPHPDLVDLYLRARPGRNAADRYTRVKKLADKHPGHRESELALGRTALEAELWGEARRHLMAAGGDAPTEEVCRLLAELEERENDDREAARAWLMRATDAPADPAWVCASCGAVASEWHATCGACGSFDSFSWCTPPRVVEPEGGTAAVARLEDTERPKAIEDAETAEVTDGDGTGGARPGGTASRAPEPVHAESEADARQAERQPS
jgi:HemY protein